MDAITLKHTMLAIVIIFAIVFHVAAYLELLGVNFKYDWMDKVHTWVFFGSPTIVLVGGVVLGLINIFM